MKKRKVSSFDKKKMRIEKDAKMKKNVSKKDVKRIMLVIFVIYNKSKKMSEKRNEHTFDFETRSFVLIVNHMKFSIYQ